jgi:hypothetical protein
MCVQVITCRAFNTIQSGRYYVALSLVEAEALRGVLHLRQVRWVSSPTPGAAIPKSHRHLG